MIGMFATPARSAAVAIRSALPALLMLACAWPLAAGAQSYPEHSIRMVVPYAAGGSVDLLGRSIAEKMSVALGKSVIADNRVGANGTIAHEIVATAPPDGYTIGMSGTSPLVLAPWQIKNLPYDTTKDFAFLACPGTTPFVLDVSPSLPVKNIKELVAYAKAHPGKLNYGSAGIGNSAHLSAELFKRATGIDMVHVPYKGNALAMQDLIAGNIQVLFDPVQTSIPQIKSGRVRALAVTSKARFAELPDLPTVAESGYPDYDFVVWYAFVAPAATPAPIVAKLNAEINMAVRDPAMKAKFATLGADLTESTPDQCAAFVKSELGRWGKLMAEVGIRPE